MRAWLAEHPTPTGRELAEAGYVAPHWPRPWGLDADPIHQLIIDDELAAAGVRRPPNPIGIGWAGPDDPHAGTEEQKERYLFPLLAGEEIWCQLFSEPGCRLATSPSSAPGPCATATSGSSTARRSGRRSAQSPDVRHPHRPHRPRRAKHEGISYFICPMDAPGIEIRPIIEMTGAHTLQRGVLRPTCASRPRTSSAR